MNHAQGEEASSARTDLETLRRFYDRPGEEILADEAWPIHHEQLLSGLESGALRAARPASDQATGWRAVPWIKKGILLGFRGMPGGTFEGWGEICFDRLAYPPRRFRQQDGVRLVPGGSAVRRGAHVAAGVVIMPPAYINVGAYVGRQSMVDSHALVGSCAQIGEGVHLSAGVQIGGVLEPVGGLPVVVEDGAFIGGQCGLFEGSVIGSRAVLAPGVHLTESTAIYDLVHEQVRRGRVPDNAVVVPGTRPARGDFATRLGLGLYAPVIVKYRDSDTNAALLLEEALR